MDEKEEKPTIADFDTEEILAEIHGRGYTATKMRATSGATFNVSRELLRFRGDSFRFGVVSDTHLASAYQQLTHLNTFYTICARRRIKVVFHCGDLVAGGRVYRGQEFDLFMHGYLAQRNYVVTHYPKRKGVRTKIIGGN